MSTVTTVTINSATGWTRVDSLASHTYVDVKNPSDSASLGLRISGSDPGSGTAWNASGSRIVRPDTDWQMKLGTSDQVWARSESGTIDVQVAEAA